MFRALAFTFSFTFMATCAVAESQSISLLAPPFPCLSQQQPTATLASAYQVQQQRNQLRQSQEPVVGFKAGLTTVLLQQRFRSDGPVIGVLFAFGERTTNAGIVLAEMLQPKLETEIGFIAGKAIRQPLSSITELRQYFQQVVPAIEVPDVSFVTGCQPNAIDLVAINVGVARHLRGEPKRWAEMPDLNTLGANLQRDGVVIANGAANAVQPSIEGSLLLLVNEVLKQGYLIEPGHLFITGAMSGLIEAKPGQHVADFGPLGTLQFTVK